MMATFDPAILCQQETKSNDGFDTMRIPDEIWLDIFSQLSNQDYLQVRLTCQHFADLSTTTSLRKNWKLMLRDEKAVQKLKAHIDEYGIGTFPISGMYLYNIKDSNDLGCILKAFSRGIRVLSLKDAPVFQNVDNANLIYLEELRIFFEEIYHNEEVFWDLKCYKSLHTINFKLRMKWVYRMMLKNLTEAGENIHLKSIKINYNESYDMDENFLTVLKIHGCYLEKLCLDFEGRGSLHFHEKMCALFRCMTHIESLTLWKNFLYDDDVENLLNSLPQTAPLYKIKFGECGDDEILKLVISKWTKTLTNLKLDGSELVTSNGIKEISKLCDNLTSLEIMYVSGVILMDVIKAVASQKNLKLCELKLHSEYLRMCNASIDMLVTNLPNLKVLDLKDFHDSDKVVINLSQLKFLEVLKLHRCNDLVIDYVLSNLRNLYLSHCATMTSEDFIHIAKNCPALETLKLFFCESLDDEAVYFIYKKLT